MDPLQASLALLDQAAAVISALLEQIKAKPEEKKDLSKQAEIFAGKTGLPFDQTYDMLKKAEASGFDLDTFEKVASQIKVNTKDSFQFGKLSDEPEVTMAKTAREKANLEFSQLDI